MVDNKKIVKGFVAGAALTGAFIAPATAQAADNIGTPSDMMDGIQNAEATQARQEARKERDTARNQAKTFHDLNKKKNVYNVKNNNYQKQLTKYDNGEIDEAKLKNAENQLTNAKKSYEDKLNNLFVDKSEDKELKDTRSSYNKALREYGNAKKKLKEIDDALNKAETIDAEAEKKYEEAKAKYEEAKTKYEPVKKEYNNKLDAAKNGVTDNDLYKSLMVEGNQKIDAQKEAEKSYEAVVAQEWGGWTREHSLTKKDDSQKDLINKFKAELDRIDLKERRAIAKDDVVAQQLDPTKLFLQNDHDVTVWFLDEGAGYRNELAYETSGNTNDKGIIFDDVSKGNGNNRLQMGDFVELGSFEAGTQFNFLLRADGADGTKTSNGDIYGADASLNADSLEHMMAWEIFVDGREYMLMGFEDLRKGGDKDYNDTIFVVDFGKGNLTNKFSKAATVPEASNMAAILGVTGAGLMLRRRRRKKKSVM
ncbi:hypothetical protein Riv7116_3403 [Rivularia sp. PCC 7116]|uniref:DUF4114 domain-containing protein n=1 Tax=Rivularia sp. PCC 7116 TaxID=373994 RepID=UPI00029EDE50|nr:DUF4114 domain-containing protein [Rivularia sp. PCC 7116]AFY55859.1 hypothetical protein Riv7116_3403 [Rivularia sp. PCC 7116]